MAQNRAGKAATRAAIPRARRQCVDDKPRTQTKHDDEPRLFSVYGALREYEQIVGTRRGGKHKTGRCKGNPG